ncbi:MAG: glutathione S-transferase family protein, partial [Pseudomonadota bacterium]
MATLLHHPLCAFSRSIRLALAECGVEVELNEEKPWEWRPEFLALNPAGTLPVFIPDEGAPIAGAYPISEWLSDTMDERPVTAFLPFPGDPAARSEARRLVEWFHHKFYQEVTDYLVVEKVFRRFGPERSSPNMDAMRAGRE